jgi:acetolactate synthase small subunit
MQKTISILANNQPSFLLQVTDLLLKHRVKIDNFISNVTEEPGRILITITICLDEMTFEQLVQRLFKMYDVVEIRENIE